MRRVDDECPIRSIHLQRERESNAWWDTKLTKRIAEALWSAGRLAIRQRTTFQRSYDLVERVIPSAILAQSLSDDEALDRLLLRALEGHGWATSGSLAATWRLANRRAAITASLQRLAESELIIR